MGITYYRRTGYGSYHGIAASSTFLPVVSRGLAARWVADDLIDVIADGAKVDTWTDATGNGNDLTQGTDANRPVFNESNPQFNGHASVDFAKASTHYLAASSPPLATLMTGSDKPATVFVVVRKSTKVTADECVLSLGKVATGTASLASFRYRFSSSNTQRQSFVATDDTPTTATLVGLNEVTDLGPQVLCWSLDGNTFSGYIAGATQNPLLDLLSNNVSSGSYSTLGTITFDRLSVGAQVRNTVTLPAEMEIAEILFYTEELTEAERLHNGRYLYNRYCLSPITAAFPAKLLDGLIHLWDARSIVGPEDNPTTTFPAEPSISSTSFTAASSSVAPLARIDTSTGDKYLAFNGTDDLMTAGVAADWRFLHDGSDFTIAVVYRVPSTRASTLIPIIDTLGNNTANVGFGIYHDAVSDADSLQIKIGNDTTAVIDHDSQDGGSRLAMWHIAMITFESAVVVEPDTEEQFQVYLDGENYASFDRLAVPIAATDPQGTLTLGGLVGGTAYGRIDIATIAIWDRKLSRFDEVKLANEILASQLSSSHVSVAAGNGLANILADANPHRAFPGLVWTDGGYWLLVYRRATTHGASAGVACMVTGDGFRWSEERILFNDSSNYDWRGVNALTKLSTGRLLLGMNLSETDSTLMPYTSSVIYSDDNGQTWSSPIFISNLGDSWVGSGTMDYDEGLNSIVELEDGSLLGHFMARFDGDSGDALRIAQVRSYDEGLTWTEPVQLYYGATVPNGGNFPQTERIQEPFCLRFDDTGELLLAIRADVTATNTVGNIYFARSTDNGNTWTPGTMTAGDRIDGWGNPRMIRDPSEPYRIYLFHRLASTNVAVWRYSTDRGATWSDPQPISNLDSTTTIVAYNGMTYAYPAVDSEGAVWLAYGLERQPDSDIFVRRWLQKPEEL